MVAHWIIWTVVAVGIVLVIGTFAPIPGYYNVQVSVTAVEISAIIFVDFEITSVTTGAITQSTFFDWAALGISGPSVEATYTMTVCISGSHCESKSATQWFSSLPVINGGSPSATTDFVIGYIPAGCNQPITATLTGGGQTAGGSGSVNVGGGC